MSDTSETFDLARTLGNIESKLDTALVEIIDTKARVTSLEHLRNVGYGAVAGIGTGAAGYNIGGYGGAGGSGVIIVEEFY